MGTPRTGATVPRELVAPRHLGQPRTCHRGVSPPVSHSQGRGCPSATPRAPPKQHNLLEAAGAGAVASLQHLRPRSQPRFCPAGNAGVWGTGSVARRPSRQREGRWLAPWTNGARVWGRLCGRGLLCSRPAAEGRSPETLALPHSRATGQGMPAGQQACINCLEEAERAPCVFRSRPGDSTPPHTHTHSCMSCFKAIARGGEALGSRRGSLGSNLSAAAYRLSDRGERAGFCVPPGPRP